MCAASDGGSLFLIGFMGAGKSTVGSELSRASGRCLIDLDRLIVDLRGLEIPEIFSREGEAAFRDLETAALRSLEGRTPMVVATGGGIVGRDENWRLMRRLGRTVYLRCRWETLRRRLAGGSGRPLADDGDWQRVEALWHRRLPFYESADLIVEADEATPGELAKSILELEGKQG